MDGRSYVRMNPVHLVDTTLFYSPTSGGVKRYLTAKHAWLAAHTSWDHTIVVPGRETHVERGGVCTLSGYRVPGTFNYRLPLNPRRWTRLLAELQPTLIEAGDAFHPGWCSAWTPPRSAHSAVRWRCVRLSASACPRTRACWCTRGASRARKTCRCCCRPSPGSGRRTICC
ncbi:MAG: hypothetical protein ACRETP_10955 [Steroidobacteraceae bacterium]